MRVLLGVASALGLGLIGCGSAKPKPKPTPAPTQAPTPPPAAPTPSPIVTEPETVRNAWANHFTAFSEKDVERIAQDYDDASVVSVYNDECTGAVPVSSGGKTTQVNISGYEEYVGVAAIKGFFTGLFKTLKKDGKDLELELANFTDDNTNPIITEFPKANVFLVWKTTDGNVFPYATDTFFWKNRSAIPKILKQNIVVTSPIECSEFEELAIPPSGVAAEMFATYKNAFAGQNKNEMVRSYAGSSVINFWDNTEKTYKSFESADEKKDFWESLWFTLNKAKQGTDLGYKQRLVKFDTEDKSVFTVWDSFAFTKATDSFYLDDKGFIIVHNVVVSTAEEKSNMAIHFL